LSSEECFHRKRGVFLLANPSVLHKLVLFDNLFSLVVGEAARIPLHQDLRWPCSEANLLGCNGFKMRVWVLVGFVGVLFIDLVRAKYKALKVSTLGCDFGYLGLYCVLDY